MASDPNFSSVALLVFVSGLEVTGEYKLSSSDRFKAKSMGIHIEFLTHFLCHPSRWHTLKAVWFQVNFDTIRTSAIDALGGTDSKLPMPTLNAELNSLVVEVSGKRYVKKLTLLQFLKLDRKTKAWSDVASKVDEVCAELGFSTGAFAVCNKIRVNYVSAILYVSNDGSTASTQQQRDRTKLIGLEMASIFIWLRHPIVLKQSIRAAVHGFAAKHDKRTSLVEAGEAFLGTLATMPASILGVDAIQDILGPVASALGATTLVPSKLVADESSANVRSMIGTKIELQGHVDRIAAIRTTAPMLAFCSASVGFSESDPPEVQERKLNGIYSAVSMLISSAYPHHKDALNLVLARQIFVRMSACRVWACCARLGGRE